MGVHRSFSTLLDGTGTGHFAGFFSTSGILRHNVAGATDTTALDAIEQMRSGPSGQLKVLWCVADVCTTSLDNARFATAAAHQSTTVTPMRSRSRFYSPMWSTRWTSPPIGAERLREIMAALVDRAAVVVQCSEGMVGGLSMTGSWWCSAAGRRSALALAGLGALCQCIMSPVTLGPSRSWTSELSLVIGALFRRWRMPTALGLAGLVLALTWLAISVHVHGWVTAFDAPTASWIRSVGRRSHGLNEASLITAWLGTPVKVAAAGLIGGALLSWRARSLRPGAVVVGTVGGAVLARTAIGALIYRPATEAEIQASPLLSPEHHPFPSGHVAGIGALLGIIAVCIAIGRSRTVQALLTVVVGAGVVVVAFSRLYFEYHWLSDVIGGALLAGVAVILGTVALTTRCDQSVRARSAPRGTPTITNSPSARHR